jgi:peptidoglycan/xylan/chitin deacetylase (PgdA/CDA1 family)
MADKKPKLLGDGKKLILSFDDGPSSPTGNNPRGALRGILDTLAENEITAEFYVIGSKAAEYPEMIQAIAGRRHRIYNHTWTHPRLTKVTQEVVRDELKKTQDVITKLTGVPPTKVRPPYGEGGFPGKIDSDVAAVAKELSLTIQVWDIDTNDWRQPKGIDPRKLEDIEGQFKKQKGKTQFNVLMHVLDDTAWTLPWFIDQLKGWGFTFADP